MMKMQYGVAALALSALTSAGGAEQGSWTAEEFFRAAVEAYSTDTTYDFTIVDRRHIRSADSNDVPRAAIPAGVTDRVRWIAVPGLRNVRDIGGWTGLQSGRVYRGSAFMWHDRTNEAYAAEAPRAQKVLVDGLGLRAELDLRGVQERLFDTKMCVPKHSFAEFGIRSLCVPLGNYMGAFDGSGSSWRQAMLCFADPANFPIYVHCAGGADRTGTLVFLLEALCGVPEWKLDIDYELTGLAKCFNVRRRTDTGTLCYRKFKDALRERYAGATINEKVEDYCRKFLKLTDRDIRAIRLNLMLPKDGLWKSSPAMWQAPKTYPIKNMSTPQVQAMAVEGEPYKGRPTRFFAYWGLPKGASPTNRVPGIVLVHGGAGTAFAGWVKTWNDRGYAAIAMDNCGGIPNGVRELGGTLRFPMSGPGGWGDANYRLSDGLLTDQWSYHAIATVIRSHSFLRSLPEVNPDCIGLTGISWGDYLTACALGIDERFRFAVPVYGCAYLRDHSAWAGQIKSLGRLGERWDELWDAHNFLPNGRMPVLWVTGSNDHFFPLDSLQRGYDLPEPAPYLAVRVRMPHGHPPTGDPKEIRMFADHFAFGRPAYPELKVTCADRLLKVSWNGFGRKVAKAELVTTASDARNWEKRPYAAKEIAFDEASLSAEVPADTVIGWVNLTFDDGLIASTRHFTFAH